MTRLSYPDDPPDMYAAAHAESRPWLVRARFGGPDAPADVFTYDAHGNPEPSVDDGCPSRWADRADALDALGRMVTFLAEHSDAGTDGEWCRAELVEAPEADVPADVTIDTAINLGTYRASLAALEAARERHVHDMIVDSIERDREAGL